MDKEIHIVHAREYDKSRSICGAYYDCDVLVRRELFPVFSVDLPFRKCSKCVRMCETPDERVITGGRM